MYKTVNHGDFKFRWVRKLIFGANPHFYLKFRSKNLVLYNYNNLKYFYVCYVYNDM